jgi:hypothetical protein
MLLLLVLLIVDWDERIAFSTVEYRRLIAHGYSICWRGASLLLWPWDAIKLTAHGSAALLIAFIPL